MNDFTPFAKTAGKAQVDKKFVCRIDGADLYLVDGAAVREGHSSKWLGGSNWMADRYFIPNREYWLESSLCSSSGDGLPFLLHETTECLLMRRGMTYDDAHALADLVESSARPCVDMWRGEMTGEKLRKALSDLAGRDFGRRANDRAREIFGCTMNERLEQLSEGIE